MITFDKDELKESLTIDQVFEFVAELGGEPRYDKGGTIFVSKTICHNRVGEGSHKLYYYDNTHLFKCYTDCGTTFDIYELVLKTRKLIGEDWQLFNAIRYVANYFGISGIDAEFEEKGLDDWEVLMKYDKNKQEREEKKVELKIYDSAILTHFPRPIIDPWEKEGISVEVMNNRGICYDPVNEGIVIPHYNIDGDLIGIRERTLIKENEVYGKYKPAILNKKMYNHPLGFNLYNLNNSKENIKILKKAIVFEGEKSPMLYASYFGEDNDITVAACGSALISYQVNLLLSLGVEEIIIAFDKQFQALGDEEWQRWTKKLTDINNKYSKYCQISFMFDKWDMLDYKMSPIDNGKDIFLELFKRRVIL